MTMYKLYLKTHNKTQKKYLGKTISDDVHEYKGSGIYWTRHLSKHGYDVTTKLLFQSTDYDGFCQVAKEYSKMWNVTESKEFCNLKDEVGDGGFDFINKKGLNRHRSPEFREKMRKIAKRLHKEGKIKTFPKHASKLGTKRLQELYPEGVWKGKTHTEEAKNKIGLKTAKHQKGKGNSQYGTMWITNGTINQKIKIDESMPEGFRKGRVL